MSRTPPLLAELGDALRHRDATRLHEAAHKLYGTVAAFSTAAGAAVSDLEELAAAGRLDEARPLVGRIEAMVQELIKQMDGISIEALKVR
jgi:hypothetical protein